jgi:hypothetical protein
MNKNCQYNPNNITPSTKLTSYICNMFAKNKYLKVKICEGGKEA